MPRNVRNFWLELKVDGRLTRIKTGPRNKDGGFTMNIFMRNKGMVQQTGTLVGSVEPSNNNLILRYVPQDGKILKLETSIR